MDGRRERIAAVVREVVREFAAAGRLGAAPVPASTAPGARRPLVAANWKMNLRAAEARAWPPAFRPPAGCELVVCPPAVLLHPLREALPPGVALGAQNLHPEPKGAFTGEHAPGQLADAGARWVLVGHSERRAMFGDTDAQVARKTAAALGAGLRPVVCLGERLAEREAGATYRVLRAQLSAALAELPSPRPEPDGLALAYEPVWAIGTGRNASAEQAQEALAFLRDRLAERVDWPWASRVRILYGGSVTPANAAELAARPDLDGFLVGGASLDAAAFAAVAAAAARRSAGGAP